MKTDFWYGMPGDVEYLNKDIPLRDSMLAGQNGNFSSGYDHYVKNGKAEGRTYNMFKNFLSPKIAIPVVALFILFKTGMFKKLLSKMK